MKINWQSIVVKLSTAFLWIVLVLRELDLSRYFYLSNMLEKHLFYAIFKLYD